MLDSPTFGVTGFGAFKSRYEGIVLTGLGLLVFAGNAVQLVPDGTLLLHLIVIVGMVWLLNRALFRPINRILEERSLRTECLLNEARDAAAAVEEKLTHYERGLRGARAEGYRLLELQKGEALRDRDSQLASAKAEVGKLTAVEKQNIAEQVEAARATLAIEARRIGLEIGTRILGRPVND